MPDFGGRGRVAGGFTGETAGEDAAEMGERLVEGSGNVSHFVVQEGGNGALLCALKTYAHPRYTCLDSATHASSPCFFGVFSARVTPSTAKGMHTAETGTNIDLV